MKRLAALVICGLVTAGTVFGGTITARAEETDASLEEIFEVYNNFEGGTDENGEPMVLAPNPMADEEADLAPNPAADQVQPVSIDKKGKVLKVKFESNTTTGYSWQTKVAEGKKALKYVKKNYSEAENTESGLVGAPGYETILLKGLKKGTAKVTFTYSQAESQETDGTCTIKVKIGKNGIIKSFNEAE